LAAELNAARERDRLARRRFQEIVAAVPSGLQAPDSSLHIKQAGKEQSCAGTALICALDRWTSFVIHGLVPEDLADSQDL